jgi:hypothetical protein
MQPDCFGQMVPHPAAILDMRFGRRLDSLTGQPEPIPHRFHIGGALMVGGPQRPAPVLGVALQRPPQPKHRVPVPLQQPV